MTTCGKQMVGPRLVTLSLKNFAVPVSFEVTSWLRPSSHEKNNLASDQQAFPSISQQDTRNCSIALWNQLFDPVCSGQGFAPLINYQLGRIRAKCILIIYILSIECACIVCLLFIINY